MPFGRHADALVGHREHEAGGRDRARHHDRGVRRRERGRVLEQLGEQVRDVGDGTTGHREVVVDADELDAGEVGDLGGRGAHDVDERDGLLPLARLLGAGEHEEALGVAAHAGGHVVELEQRVERGGVVLVALEVVEQLELALARRLWLRRARFTNRSPMPLRSRRDCSCATSRVTASTSLNAWASSPISSSDVTSMRDGLHVAHVATGAERLDQLPAAGAATSSRAAAVRRRSGPTIGPRHEPDQERASGASRTTARPP